MHFSLEVQVHNQKYEQKCVTQILFVRLKSKNILYEFLVVLRNRHLFEWNRYLYFKPAMS